MGLTSAVPTDTAPKHSNPPWRNWGPKKQRRTQGSYILVLNPEASGIPEIMVCRIRMLVAHFGPPNTMKISRGSQEILKAIGACCGSSAASFVPAWSGGTPRWASASGWTATTATSASGKGAALACALERPTTAWPGTARVFTPSWPSAATVLGWTRGGPTAAAWFQVQSGPAAHVCPSH